MHRRIMATIITPVYWRPRLPRRLLNDGWWLEQPPVRPSVIAFPKRSAPKLNLKPNSNFESKSAARHFTLVTSRK